MQSSLQTYDPKCNPKDEFMRVATLCWVLLAILNCASFVWSEEIEASVGRGGQNQHQDVLTVQLLLNQVPPAAGGPESLLVPDGISGPKTVAAILRFQKHQLGDLAASGRFDPGAHPLQRLVAMVEQESLNDRIVRVAEGERLFWQDGKRNELDEGVTRRLQQYWKAVGLEYSLEELRTKDFQNKNPWSAAFVSWVMKQAGAGDNFRYSASHWQYVAAAKKNREAGNDNPIQAYRVKEQEAAPGDVVVKRRGDSMATYENIEKGHITHGDIVISIANGKAETIGGNVSDSVKTTNVALDDDLKVTDERFFAIVKVK